MKQERYAVMWDPLINKGTVCEVFDSHEEAWQRYDEMKCDPRYNAKVVRVVDAPSQNRSEE